MIEIILLLTCFVLLIKPLGDYLHFVYSGRMAERFGVTQKAESIAGRLIGMQLFEEQGWKLYLQQVLIFFLLSFIFVFCMLLSQSMLPGGDAFEAISPSLAFNIAASFLTGTNIQTYMPETTLSMVSQNFSLVLLQFIAPAVDMSVAVALFRSFTHTSDTIGNFWRDMLRSICFVLIPLALILAVFNLSQGAIQSLEPIIATTLSGDTQEIITGPAASMQSISMLATNGGGYYVANAAHPLATPTPLAGFVNMLVIALLPAAFFCLFGAMVHDKRQGITLLCVMTLCVGFFASIMLSQEMHLPKALDDLQIEHTLGNMEGKELRFGSQNSALWGTLATATTNGSAIAAYDSFAPLSLLAMMLQMLFGEILFGGAGVGVINMLAVVIITVFMASLMIGRTPEYLRKKISVSDIRLAVFILVIPAIFLCATISFSVYLPVSTQSMQSQDIHGYTESLYAIISAAFNNGSALNGISLNNTYYNVILAMGMLAGGIAPKVIACVLAGSLASKQRLAVNVYSLQTHGVMFAILLLVVMVLGALSYLPILILGPISSHMQGLGG